MGSKNQPGQWDCYAHAEPDEPMFVLLGRDPAACTVVRQWADLREREGIDAAKLAEARACADAMEAWARNLGKGDRVDVLAILAGIPIETLRKDEAEIREAIACCEEEEGVE